MSKTEDEYVEFGEIGWYDSLRGHGEKPSIKWIWSGPDKKFPRANDPAGFAGGEPYIFQHIIQDAQPVYVRKPI